MNRKIISFIKQEKNDKEDINEIYQQELQEATIIQLTKGSPCNFVTNENIQLFINALQRHSDFVYQLKDIYYCDIWFFQSVLFVFIF